MKSNVKVELAMTEFSAQGEGEFEKLQKSEIVKY